MAKAPATDKANVEDAFEPFGDAWLPIGVAAVALAPASRRAAAQMTLMGPSQDMRTPTGASDDLRGFKLDQPRLEKQTGCFELTWFDPHLPQVRIGYKLPPFADWKTVLGDSGRFSPALLTDLESRLASAWAILRYWFNEAAEKGELQISGREQSPLNRRVTLVPPEVLKHFKMVDWNNGVAEAMTGDRLFSLHARPLAATVAKAQNVTAFVTDLENQEGARQSLERMGIAPSRGAIARRLAGMFNEQTSGAETTAASIEGILRRQARREAES